jgi:hypothetical protein
MNKHEHFSPGDRVKLTDYAANGLNLRKRKEPLDWRERQGTVHKIVRTGVRVLWDGRKCFDVQPPVALMVITDDTTRS